MNKLIYYIMYQTKYNKYANKLNKIQFGGKLPIVGFHSAQGGRSYQEDRLSVLSTTKPEMLDSIKEAIKHNLIPRQVTMVTHKEYIILSVFDGHGDSAITSDYLVNTLPNRCKIEIDKLPDLKNPALIANILDIEFKKIDAEDVAPMREPITGSTGIVCVITNDHIIVANIADSPAILFTKAGVKLNQTVIHNCNNPAENARINAELVYPLCLPVHPFTPYRRLKSNPSNKGLDMTRAFGDTLFKPKANAVPQTYIWDRVPEQILCVCSDSFFETKLDRSKYTQDEQDIVDEVLPILTANNFDPQVSAIQIVETRSNTIKGDNTSMILAIL